MYIRGFSYHPYSSRLDASNGMFNRSGREGRGKGMGKGRGREGKGKGKKPRILPVRAQVTLCSIVVDFNTR